MGTGRIHLNGIPDLLLLFFPNAGDPSNSVLPVRLLRCLSIEVALSDSQGRIMIREVVSGHHARH